MQRIFLNTILYGPPGTGKTYNTMYYSVAICDLLNDVTGNNIDSSIYSKSYEELKKRYDELVNEKRIAFTTFHQSFAYEDFIEGIRPNLSNHQATDVNSINSIGEGSSKQDESSSISYSIHDGVFKSFCLEAQKHSDQKYVFIIDEINRGNISKILGELITLLEPSKRKGSPEELETILPYSKEKFSVPNNIYIIGTMNTADRSIAIMDTALRRRFHFIEMCPQESLLDGIFVEGIDIKALLSTINERIEYLFDREHKIGHSYFIGLKNNNSLDKLAEIFKYSVVPLLQEYFYDDYEKIAIILGEHSNIRHSQFITKMDKPFNCTIEGLSDIEHYKINEDSFTCIDAYKSIYST